MTHKVMLVIASDGYHPIEYSVPKRILEHSGITVITASDKAGTATAKDQTTTEVEKTVDQLSVDDFDALFFIGGPGALDHLDNETSYQLLRKTAEAKKPFGAICASVRILAKSGIIKGKKVTGWNGDNELGPILEQAGAIYVRKDVAVDGTIVTAVGPQAAQEFGAKILTVLGRG
ncbi:DJ-1/PfpI family protein [Candidatus Dependentiae bacterium]